MARAPSPARGTRALPKTFRRFEHVPCDDFPIEADVLVPNIRHAGFDGDTFTAAVRQNFFAVFCRLAVEPFEARHRNTAHAVAELLRGCQRVLQFASAREDDQIKFSALSLCDVTATQHSFAPQIWINVV